MSTIKYRNILADGRNCFFRCLAADIARDSDDAAAFVFLRQISAVARRFPDARIVVCWEGGHAPWRKDLLPTYKERIDPPDDTMLRVINRIKSAQPVLEEMLSVLGIAQGRVRGYEGDDITAFYALTMSGATLILSSDNDFYTLLADAERRITHQLRPGEDIIITAAIHEQKKEVPPYLWPLYKACVGDDGDKVPGVLGVGPKTAVQVCAEVAALLDPRVATHEALVEATMAVCSSTTNRRMTKLLGTEDLLLSNLKLLDLVYAVERMPAMDRRALRAALDLVEAPEAGRVRDWLMEHHMVSLVADFNRWIGPFLRRQPTSCPQAPASS